MLADIDGVPLDQASQNDLSKLFASCANAQLRAPLLQRKDPTVLARSVLTAFETTHEVDGGQWVRKPMFHLQGGLPIGSFWEDEDSEF